MHHTSCKFKIKVYKVNKKNLKLGICTNMYIFQLCNWRRRVTNDWKNNMRVYITYSHSAWKDLSGPFIGHTEHHQPSAFIHALRLMY